MSTIIQIKRSANVEAPLTTDLLIGELAYSYDKTNNGAGAKLYIEALDSGDSEVIHSIGGKYYTDAVDGATSSNTANEIVKRDGSGNFSAGIVTADLYGQANTTVKLATTRYINLSGDATGSAAFDGTGNADITVSVSGITNVQLGTNTTGDYVANLTQGSGIALTNLGGESANVTVALAASGVEANTYGGASQIPVITVDQFGRITTSANVSVAGVNNFTASGNTFTISTADGNTFSASFQENSVRLGTDTTGDYVSNVLAGTGVVATYGGGSEGQTPTLELDTSGVTAATYGGTNRALVSLVVDTYGRITSAANITLGDIALGTETTGAYVANLIAGTGITITGLGDEGTTPTITNAGVTSITGTSNEIEVSSSTGAVTIGLPNNVTISNDLSVLGNLNITGNVTSLGAEDLVINDPLIHLANNNSTTDVVDIGFEGKYFDSGTSSIRHSGLFRDASDSGKFKLFANVSADITTALTVPTDDAGFTVATLVANLTGGTVSGLTANIAVGDGGTGRGTLTTNSILYGQGTSAVGMLTGSAYQVLQLNGSGVPVFSGIDGGSY